MVGGYKSAPANPAEMSVKFNGAVRDGLDHSLIGN